MDGLLSTRRTPSSFHQYLDNINLAITIFFHTKIPTHIWSNTKRTLYIYILCIHCIHHHNCQHYGHHHRHDSIHHQHHYYHVHKHHHSVYNTTTTTTTTTFTTTITPPPPPLAPKSPPLYPSYTKTITSTSTISTSTTTPRSPCQSGQGQRRPGCTTRVLYRGSTQRPASCKQDHQKNTVCLLMSYI